MLLKMIKTFMIIALLIPRMKRIFMTKLSIIRHAEMTKRRNRRLNLAATRKVLAISFMEVAGIDDAQSPDTIFGGMLFYPKKGISCQTNSKFHE